jgi:hypothetical protein
MLAMGLANIANLSNLLWKNVSDLEAVFSETIVARLP